MQRLGILLATGAVLALASPALITSGQEGQHVPTQPTKSLHMLTDDHISATGEPPGITGSRLEMTRVKRLTAFAKPAETVPPAKQGKGRECKQDADCGPIPYTSCLADTRDGKKRCLCSDYTPPINGNCKQKNRVKRGYVPPGNVNRPRALYERCEADADCLEGGECRANGNATANIGKNVRICLCQPGRTEDKKMCNGSEGLGRGYHMAIAFSALALILRFSPN